MKLVKLSDLFSMSSGSKMDLNKQEIVSSDGVNFVSRTSKNSGVVCKVARNTNAKLYKKGAITVTLGGTYLLSAFVQQDDFYTAQNVRVLQPKVDMCNSVKLFYCTIIRLNRFRYASHGREANKTLSSIKVPDISEALRLIPKLKITPPKPDIYHDKKISLHDRKWDFFLLSDHFNMEAGSYYPSDIYNSGKTPLVTASTENNGVSRYTDLTPKFVKNGITIGKVSCSAFYQKADFCASSDVTILTSDILNQYIGMFLVTIINMEKFKWSYGRQIRLNDSLNLRIKLPVNKDGYPDWIFMEEYIKSLPFSKNL